MPKPGDVDPTSSDPTSTAPPWFRDVVWESLLGGLCPLIPIPFVDDLALSWTRRRLISRIAARHQVSLTPTRTRRLAGRGGSFSCLMLLVKIVIYPLRKILRKLLYFLSIKDAVDTFSLLFHQGYLFERALELTIPPEPSRSAKTHGQSLPEAHLDRIESAVWGTLDSIDTKPLLRVLAGVFRGSRDSLRAAVSWISRRALSRKAFRRAEAEGLDSEKLAQESPETSQLMDRLLTTLWGEQDYRERLTAALAARLAAAERGETSRTEASPQLPTP
ncbi:MAG: hypothetical protein K8J08_04705 [Thermoanaerobaculia bacterium]|nr:hypothetical protein [Thermoanaerobaculia bacterium]